MTYLVGIAGGSGSGKGTIATLIKKQLELWGLTCSIFSTDDAYVDLSWKSVEERHAMSFDPKLNYDCPNVINFPKIVSFAQRILSGEAFSYFKYDFGTHCYDPTKIEEIPINLDVGLFEGIYALWSGPPISDELISLYNHRLFVITDPRIAQRRRIKRDTKPISEGGRNRKLDDVLKQLDRTVDPMYDRYVAPTRNNAQDIIDWKTEEPDDELAFRKELLRLARPRAIHIYEEVVRTRNEDLLLPELDLENVKIEIR